MSNKNTLSDRVRGWLEEGVKNRDRGTSAIRDVRHYIDTARVEVLRLTRSDTFLNATEDEQCIRISLDRHEPAGHPDDENTSLVEDVSLGQVEFSDGGYPVVFDFFDTRTTVEDRAKLDAAFEWLFSHPVMGRHMQRLMQLEQGEVSS